MLCDMCGKEAELFKTKIENTLLDVCSSCGRYGNVLRKSIEERQPSAQKKEAITKPTEELIIEDYHLLVRQKREKLGLTHEEFAKMLNEKVSLIHKLETGSIALSVPLARKLEKQLHLTLIEKYPAQHQKQAKISSASFTIGDLIKVK